MQRHYLLFASLAYAFPILRPLEREIRRRGDVAAWFLEPGCDDLLLPNEQRLTTFNQVRRFNPEAVFAPGNRVYDFFPGIKVELFHGYPIAKRIARHDDHFKIRGWFDIYCTQGPASTIPFKHLEKRLGFFRVYETGWSKADAFFGGIPSSNEHADVPTILYASTFTNGISSAQIMPQVIERLAAIKPWRWKIMLHPKLNDPQLIARYRNLSAAHPNVEFLGHSNDVSILRSADAMLSDSSSIIVEFMLLDKPVVTYRNTTPGPHLINVTHTDDIEAALERALQRPSTLLNAINRYTAPLEAHRDGQNCERILNAVDDFKLHYAGRIRRKPCNLLRKFELRRELAAQWLPYALGYGK